MFALVSSLVMTLAQSTTNQCGLGSTSTTLLLSQALAAEQPEQLCVRRVPKPSSSALDSRCVILCGIELQTGSSSAQQASRQQ
jgi:hypothetical protein